MKDRPWGLSTILSELIQLRSVLETIRNLTEQSEEGDDTSQNKDQFSMLRMLCQNGGAMDMCIEELDQLAEKLAPGKRTRNLGRLTKAFFQATGWRLKSADARIAIERLERFKSTFNLALNVSGLSMTSEIRTLAADNNTRLQALELPIREMSQTVNKSKFEAMAKWLSPVDFGLSYGDALKMHKSGTSTWFLRSDDFAKWKSDPSSFIWISGIAGSGKTVLSSQIVQTMLQDTVSEETITAFFYCDFRRPESQSPQNVIGSILSQLCLQCVEIPKPLQQLYDSCITPSGARRRPDLSALATIMHSILEENRAFILIDAIDECNHRENLLTFLSDLTTKALRVSLIATARAEPDVRRKLAGYKCVSLETKSNEVAKDISFYVWSRLENEQSFSWLNQSIRTEIHDELTKNTDTPHMFRWVQCQLDEISAMRRARDVRRALQSLPHGLKDTYDRIIDSIPKANLDVVHRTLLWLSLNSFPIALEELWEAIAIEKGATELDEDAMLSRPEDILDICGVLIRGQERYSHVSLAHMSVREFFLASMIGPDQQDSFNSSLAKLHERLALDCLSYLSLAEFCEGPARSEEAFEDRLERHPFLDYASRSWPHHVLKARQSAEVVASAMRFFNKSSRKAFMAWVQVLNSDFTWDSYPASSTPLYYSASFGLDKLVETLIDANEPLEAPGSRYGGSALHAAVFRDHMEIASTLLKAGADPNMADLSGLVPLHCAASSGDVQMIDLLLDYGAIADAVCNGESPYDWAVYTNHTRAQKRLLQHLEKRG